MTEGVSSLMISQEYADLIISTQAPGVKIIPNATYQEMNIITTIAYIPVAQFMEGSINVYDYSSIPKLYGLAADVSIEASGLTKLRQFPSFNLRGAGVLIGIIDTGINYTLPVFEKADGTSKINRIWDQTIQGGPYPQFGPELGTVFKQEQLNQAIQSENPLSIVPSTDDNGHGTAMAAIAAGSEIKDQDFTGVAPDAELVIVKLMPAKQYLRDYFRIVDNAVCYQENSIMWALQFCYNVGRELNRPVVTCLALGSSQDSHDGISPVDQLVNGFSYLARSGVVNAAGNEGNSGRHFFGTIDPTIGSVPVELNVEEKVKGFSMQIWGTSPGIYSIDIYSPTGEYVPRIAAGLRVNRKIAFIFDETVINVEYQTVENITGDQLILLRFSNVSAGVWKFNVYGQGNLVNSFHIWLPMGDMISRSVRFIQPDIYTTVLSCGTAEFSIGVTAYNPVNQTLYVEASRGYTRSNVIKPDFAAPGVNYKAPDKDGNYVNYSGTGVAAAHTTGIVALMMEWGVTFGNQPNINAVDIKNYLIRGARRNPNQPYPNRDWGYGIVDIYNTFNILRSAT